MAKPLAHSQVYVEKKVLVSVDVNNEPGIREIQAAAIRYAEVNPQKIESWRKGAKFRSLLPEVSVDYDKTINYDSGADRYYTGPYDWGITLRWDLPDLIWNPYQKDIDIRSRLMVLLRNDVLEDVTRFYFERLKLKNEIKDTTGDQEKIRKELRIEELTAKIDALTGGYFSRNIFED